MTKAPDPPSAASTPSPSAKRFLLTRATKPITGNVARPHVAVAVSVRAMRRTPPLRHRPGRIGSEASALLPTRACPSENPRHAPAFRESALAPASTRFLDVPHQRCTLPVPVLANVHPAQSSSIATARPLTSGVTSFLLGGGPVKAPTAIYALARFAVKAHGCSVSTLHVEICPGDSSRANRDESSHYSPLGRTSKTKPASYSSVLPNQAIAHDVGVSRRLAKREPKILRWSMSLCSRDELDASDLGGFGNL